MKIVLSESQLTKLKTNIISEDSLKDIPNVHPIYHFTTSDAAHKIIDSDTLLAGESIMDDDDIRLKNSKHGRAISFTRDKNMKPSYGFGTGAYEDGEELVMDVIFVFNRDKLKTRYKLEPFSFDSIVRKSDSGGRMNEDTTPDDLKQLMTIWQDPEALAKWKEEHKDYVDKFSLEDEPEERATNSYVSKDVEMEERILVDKITPLRPYIMNIIYNGPDFRLKKKIKEYLGSPTYIPKPIPKDITYNNWVMPTINELKVEFYEAHTVRDEFFFDSFKDMLESIKETGRIVKVTEFNDEFIYNRTHTKNKKQLMKFVNSSEYHNKEDVESVYNGYLENKKMTLPIVVEYLNGPRELFSGNVRLDAAFHLGIVPKVLLIQSPNEYR